MTDPESGAFFLILLVVGLTIIANVCIRKSLERVGLPVMIGYLALGVVLRLTNANVNWLNSQAGHIFEFLGEIGLIVLLFRVGLDARLQGLLAQVRNASRIWAANVLVSGAAGFGACWLMGMETIPSIVVAVAFTATSIGVSVAMWGEAGALRSKEGELFLDVAELDDISGVLLLALLLAVLPSLHQGETDAVLMTLTSNGLMLLGKLLVFGAFCLVLALYLEPWLSKCFGGKGEGASIYLLLVLVGFSIAIAALAGLLGFSLAIGAFFAGLVFSRDPKAVRLENSFESIHDLFAPFFFIGIGLKVELAGFDGALLLGGVLFVASVIGKIAGTTLPARTTMGWNDALLLGVSMVPRAEIALVIMQQGIKLGPWAVTPRLFSAMVMVSVLTCIFSAVTLKPLLRRSSVVQSRGAPVAPGASGQP